MRKTFLLLPILLLPTLLLPQTAWAQVDLTLEAGYRFGGLNVDTQIVCIASINAPCPTSANTDDSSLFALTLGFPVGKAWAIELHASRQDTDLNYIDPTALILAGSDDASITVLESDLVRRFELGAWEPFAGGGIGVARLETDPVPLLNLDTDRFTANLVGGARYSFSEHLGLRLAARARWLSLPSEVDGDDVTFETSAGISFRL